MSTTRTRRPAANTAGKVPLHPVDELLHLAPSAPKQLTVCLQRMERETSNPEGPVKSSGATKAEPPAAVQLLELGAFLAPEPIPLALFSGHPELLEEPLAGVAADPDVLAADVVGAVVGFSLARRRAQGFQLHRLVQAAIRHHLTPAQRQVTQELVLNLLVAAHPGDPRDSASWGDYSELAPHVLVTGPSGDNRPDSQQLILNVVDYLQAKGDTPASRLVSMELLERWRLVLGPDHPATLASAAYLAYALAGLGDYEQARSLGQDTLERCRVAFGPDNPITSRLAQLLHNGLGGSQRMKEFTTEGLHGRRRDLPVCDPAP